MSRRQAVPMKASKPEEGLVEWRVSPSALALPTAAWSALVLVLYAKAAAITGAVVPLALDAAASAKLPNPQAVKAAVSLGLAAWTLAACAFAGRNLLRRLLPFGGSPFETFALGAALGLGLLSLAVYALGAARLWYPASFWALLAAATVVSFLPAPPSGETDPSISGPWAPAWAALLAACAVVFVVGASMPEVFFDSLFYHLGVPNLFRLEHRILRLDLAYATFIMTAHMLWGFVLTLGGDLAPKMLHVATMVPLAAAYIGFGQRNLSRGSGLLASAMFMSMPVVAYVVSRGGVEGAWAFFVFAAVAALGRGLSERDRRWAVFSGLLAGFAASCRFQGFPLLPVAALLIAWTARRDQGREWPDVLKEEAAFLAPALLVVGLYLGRNVLYHVNPFYPFGGTVFGEPRIDPARWASLIGDARRFPPSRWYPVLHPWFMVMDSRDVYDGRTGPLVLALLPLLLAVRFRGFECRFVWRAFVSLWLVWWATSPNTPRYGLPVLALLCPLLAEAVLDLARRAWAARALFAVVLAAGVLNLLRTAMDQYFIDGWPVVGGLVSADAYLGEQHQTYPTPPYEGLKWMNDHLPADARVLMIGDSRSYYADRRLVPCSVYDPQPIEAFARASRDPADLARRLREAGVTHLFLNLGEAARTQKNYELFTWDPASWATLEGFWSRWLRIAWKDESLVPGKPKALYVFELLGDQEAAAPHPPTPNPLTLWAPTSSFLRRATSASG